MGRSLKTISIGTGGGDLRFEGLRGRFFQASYTFCQRFLGISPQISDHGGIQWNFFLRYHLEGTAHASSFRDSRI
jgi:hypothetical protein